MTTSVDSTLLDFTTPEKLAIMKLNAADVDRSVFSDVGDDFVAGDADFSSSRMNGMRSMTRTSKVRSSSRRSTGNFIAAHREKMSAEMSSAAEGKFLALMDFMASASREASSLKEYWAKLVSDREAWSREREELLARIDEVAETVELFETQKSNHGREIVERKKEVEKLLLELSAALAGIAEGKKKLAERDQEIERVRGEVHEVRISTSRSQVDFDKVKSELEVAFGRLRTAESERDHSREDADKYRNELRLLTREHSELKSRFTEITFKLETASKEVTTLLERVRVLEREKEEYLYEKDRLEAELRKANHRAEDISRELSELSERLERLQRELARSKETTRTVEAEREELTLTIEHLRHELKTKTTTSEDLESRYSDILLKYERTKRETTTHQDRIKSFELEINEVRASLEKKQEEYRVIVIERDQYSGDLDDERRKLHESTRRVADLETSLRQTESSLTSVRSEASSVTERIRLIEHEREGDRDKHGNLHGEITALKEQLILLQAEITTITDARDKARKELHEYKRKYEEVTETVTSFENNDNSGELEFEIESLRTMLREAREQKERAITARATADRERDEAFAKYEEKCRELERWEESRSTYLQGHAHSHSSGGGKSTTTTRTVLRSGTSNAEHHESATSGNNGE